MHFDQRLCRSEPIVIELDGRKGGSTFELELAQALNRVSTGWWKGPLIVVLRHFQDKRALEPSLQWLAYLSVQATDCELCLEDCHPDLLRLFDSPTFRQRFNIITLSAESLEAVRGLRLPAPAL